MLNAYELADRIETSPYAEYKSAKNAANMLRQQAAKIAELEEQKQILVDAINQVLPMMED
jgi:hypothetical protein